jgi:hypothetical protein
VTQFDLDMAITGATLDVRFRREQLVIQSAGTGGMLVIGGLFAISEWPHAAIASAVVAAYEAWGAFRAWQRWRSATRDLANLEAAKTLHERAEWIAMCERNQRERASFTESGAYENASPKDAA